MHKNFQIPIKATKNFDETIKLPWQPNASFCFNDESKYVLDAFFQLRRFGSDNFNQILNPKGNSHPPKESKIELKVGSYMLVFEANYFQQKSINSNNKDSQPLSL